MNKDYLKKFLIFSVDDFDKFHRQAYPQANNRTYNSFRQSLKRLEKIYEKPLNQLNLEFLNDPNEFFNKLSSSHYSHNTNITTFSQVMKLLKIIDYPLQEYNKYQNLLNLKVKQNNEIRHDDLKEKLEYLPDINSLKKILRDKIDTISEETSFIEMKYLILLSIMILSIPLKLIQYSKMTINFIESESNYINNFLLEDANGVYYIKSKDISIKITDNYLIKLIKLWINEFNPTKHFLIQNENSKVGMNSKDLRFNLSSASNMYFDIDITNQEIRQMYMKHIMNLDPDLKEKIALSQILGYINTDTLECHNCK